MLKDYIQLGDTLDIEVGDVTTKTKVQDLGANEKFAVLQPTYKLVPVMIQEYERVRFTFYRPNGIFSFYAVLEEKVIRDNLRMYVFRLVSEIEKRQRRYGYRLPVVLPVDLKILDQEESENPAECKAKTINLSEKGVLFSCFERLEAGTRLLISLKMDGAPLALLAEVVRCEPPLQKTDPYAIAVKFYDCSKRDQMFIGRYILKKQISDRRTRQRD